MGRQQGRRPLPAGDVHAVAADEPVPVAALARLSGLTEWHLIRAFHQEFGLPPHAYHLRLRLAAAAELLAGGLSVSTAAYECGFADQSHLSRKFKEVYGLTPAAWATSVAAAPRPDAPPDALQPAAGRVVHPAPVRGRRPVAGGSVQLRSATPLTVRAGRDAQPEAAKPAARSSRVMTPPPVKLVHRLRHELVREG